jgi:hypothetical protein
MLALKKQVINFASDKRVALVYIGQKKVKDNTTEVRELSTAIHIIHMQDFFPRPQYCSAKFLFTVIFF